MRPATASRLARLAAALLVIALVLTACVSTAAPGWTFEPPPTASAAASGSAAPSGSAAASGSVAPSGSVGPSGSAPPSGSVAPSAPASSGASASAPPSGAAGESLKLSATTNTYDTATLEAKAGQAFQIVFTNNDSGVMHNVQITAPDGSKPLSGSLLTGPGSVTYSVPALSAGAYTFSCVVHPTMTGTLTVK